MLGEILAYALGRSHGREQERRRRRGRRPVQGEPAGAAEMVCLIAIIVSVVAVLIFAFIPS